MKKLFALLLAVALTATLSLGAFAAELSANPSNVAAAGDYTIGVDGNFVAAGAAAEVISVDIAWDTMSFTYSAGGTTYNPATHVETTSGGGWSDNKPGITVTNHSNVPVEAAFSFTAASGLNVTGTFYTKGDGNTYTAISSAAAQRLSLATAVGTEVANAPAGTLHFGISGDPITENKSLGTITVKIAKDTKIYTGEALAAALTSLGATGGTITLGADVALPLDANTNLNVHSFSVENGKSLVLDLNGHTVTGILYVINVDGDGSPTFIVKNGKLQCTNTSESAMDGGVITAYKVNTQINDVTITASGIFAVGIVDAAMRITDCTLNGGVLANGDLLTVANAGGAMTFAGEIVLSGELKASDSGAIFKAEAGTYNFDPTAYVDAENYTVTANENGTWTVSAKTPE